MQMPEKPFSSETKRIKHPVEMTFEELVKNVKPREFNDRELALVSKNYDKLERKDSAIKEIIFGELYKKYFPELSKTRHPRYYDGYIHFPDWHEREVNGKSMSYYLREVANAMRINPELSEDDARIVKEILPREYKIHLMPQAAHTLFIVEELLKAVRKDKALESVMHQIKVVNDTHKVRSEVMPAIVVYPALGIANAQKALDRIYGHLGKYAIMGQDITPRYNQKIDELIFYAQGSGDFKKTYKSLMEQAGVDWKNGGIFEEDMVHFKGDYHLKSPAEK